MPYESVVISKGKKVVHIVVCDHDNFGFIARENIISKDFTGDVERFFLHYSLFEVFKGVIRKTAHSAVAAVMTLKQRKL